MSCWRLGSHCYSAQNISPQKPSKIKFRNVMVVSGHGTYYGAEEEDDDNDAVGHQAVLEEEGQGVDKGNSGPAGEQLDREERVIIGVEEK